MTFKFFTFILVVSIVSVFVSAGPGFYKKKFEEKCGTDQACIAVAEKCMGEKGKRPHRDDSTRPHTDKLVAFNQCLDDNGQGTLKINEQDCVDEHPEGGRGGRGHHGKCKKEIFDVMSSMEESVAGPIRCCLSKAIGYNKSSNSDGSINVEEFRSHLQEKFTDQAILDIYETAITTCLPQGENCNFHGFRMCTFDECFKQLQSQK